MVEKQLRQMTGLTEQTLLPREKNIKPSPEGEQLQASVTEAITEQIHTKVPEIIKIAMGAMKKHQREYRLMHTTEQEVQTGPLLSTKIIELQRRVKDSEEQLAK